MGSKNFSERTAQNRPNQTTRERVVSERGRKELPPGTKGGENLKPDRHYEHKQYAFDSYCKKVLKCEAYRLSPDQPAPEAFRVFGGTVRGRNGSACGI